MIIWHPSYALCLISEDETVGCFTQIDWLIFSNLVQNVHS